MRNRLMTGLSAVALALTVIYADDSERILTIDHFVRVNRPCRR